MAEQGIAEYRAVISAGGTGGHIFPALAVAEALLSHYPGGERPRAKILVVGSLHGPEDRLARQAGLDFYGLPAKGVLGKGWRALSSGLWIARSLCQCMLLFQDFRPQVVLGFGSYASFVPVLSAVLLRLPSAIHEQNSQPGITNRILGKVVKRVFLTFPDELGYFRPAKIRETGTPVRRDLLVQPQKGKLYAPQQAKRVLILGGSQGAKAINDAVIKALPIFKSQGVTLHHQAGYRDYERVKAEYLRCGLPAEWVQDFITNMAQAYAKADLVVCRAGASTLAELTAIGLPSILIPFPYAVHHHQLANARKMEQAGAAMVLEQSYLAEINLAKVVLDFFALPSKMREMAEAAQGLSRPGASTEIVQELARLAGWMA